jgi:hypothetical protein
VSFLITRCVKRSHVVQELYENWQLAHKEAMFAGDVEDESIELCRLLEHAWPTLVANLFTGPVFNIEATGRLFQQAIRRSIQVVRGVDRLVAEAERRSYTIQEAASLRSALAGIEKLDRAVEQKWPFVDGAMVAEARAAFGRGEYQTTEELLNAAQGSCAESGK